MPLHMPCELVWLRKLFTTSIKWTPEWILPAMFLGRVDNQRSQEREAQATGRVCAAEGFLRGVGTHVFAELAGGVALVAAPGLRAVVLVLHGFFSSRFAGI